MTARMILPISVLLLIAACTPNSYSLPEKDRTRTYNASFDDVWSAAIESLDDIRATVTDQRKADGIITARTGFSMTNSAGGTFRLVLSQRSDGVRVDASMEIPSWTGDLGESERKVRTFLAGMDRRLKSAPPAH